MTDDEMKYQLTRLKRDLEYANTNSRFNPHLLRATEIVDELIKEMFLRESERLLAVAPARSEAGEGGDLNAKV